MTQTPPTRRNQSQAGRPAQDGYPAEAGYILLGVLILLALFVIAMAVAAPRIAASIQRDRDVETMRRGKQYIRAIQLYYRKFHAYPPNLDALVKTQEIRFLRRKYIDPTTGKDDWKPIAFGQNKTPMAMGFFGQPLGGTGGNVIAGTGPGGNAGLGGTPIGTPGGGLFSTPSDPASGGQAGTPPGGGTSPGGIQPVGGQPGQTGSTMGSGPTFGGAGIIGVSPASPKKSIYVYKKKDHYNEWEFLYSPMSEMQQMGGGNAGTIGQPPNNGPSFGQPPTSGPPIGVPPTGGGINTPAPPPPPPAPQQ